MVDPAKLDRLESRDDGAQDDDWEIIDATGHADTLETDGLHDDIWSSFDRSPTGAPNTADPVASRSSFTWRVIPRQGALEGSLVAGFDALSLAPSSTATPTFPPGSSSSLADFAPDGSAGGSVAPSATMPVSNTSGGRSHASVGSEDEASFADETSSVLQSMNHSPCPRSDSASSQRAAADGKTLRPLATYSDDTWDLVIISQPPIFRPVARRSSRHFIFQLPVLNLIFPGMLCILTAHHLLCGSRHQPHSFGAFPSFSTRHPCSDGLCLSS